MDLENLEDGVDDNVPVLKNEEWPEYRIRLFDNEVCIIEEYLKFTKV